MNTAFLTYSKDQEQVKTEIEIYFAPMVQFSGKHIHFTLEAFSLSRVPKRNGDGFSEHILF